MIAKKDKKLHSYYFGLVSEYLAMLLYIIKLHVILARRFKTKYGEIDFICKRFKTLVFVEVKARSFDYDEVICSKSQQKRITRAAEFFLLKNPKYHDYNLRFDLVLIRPFVMPKIFHDFTVL